MTSTGVSYFGLTNYLNPTVTVPVDTEFTVGDDGSFTIGGVKFTYEKQYLMELEDEAYYKLNNSETVRYLRVRANITNISISKNTETLDAVASDCCQKITL